MRSLTICCAVAGLIASPAAAFAGSVSTATMLQPGPPGYNRDACGGAATMVPGAAFTNGSSKGKYKFTSACKGIIQLSKLTMLVPSDGIPGTGDEAICFVNFQSNLPGPCGSFALRGEILGTAASQKIKIRLNGAADFPPGICPFLPGTDARITSVDCFVPAPAYSAAAACTGVYTPMIADPTQGLCFPASAYLANPPGTPVIAVQGVLF